MIVAVMTDYWEPYKYLVPSEQHRQSKAEAYTVEGYNSLFRHFLARFRRKTKHGSAYLSLREVTSYFGREHR